MDRFATVAGHPVLDLVNTVEHRRHPKRRTDRVVDDATALAWAIQFGVCNPAEANELAAHLGNGQVQRDLTEVRELVYDAVLTEDRDAVRLLDELSREWRSRSSLTQPDGAGGWQLRDSGLDDQTITLRIARAAVEFLTSPAATEVRQCADEACGWVYLDTSPRKNRRWCSATECGARNRARRYYAKTKAADRPIGASAGP